MGLVYDYSTVLYLYFKSRQCRDEREARNVSFERSKLAGWVGVGATHSG